MLATWLASSRIIRGGVGEPGHLITLAVAGAAYLLAVREFIFIQAPGYARHVIYACLMLSVLWRIPFFLSPPGPLDDTRRYVWDGRLQRHGYNPYVVVPADPAFSGLHTSETREMNNPDVPSPYPAGAQLFFRAVTAVRESAVAFKVVFVLCDLAIALLLLAELRRLGQGEHWVLAYAWNPLLVTDVATSSHVDIFGALLLLVSVAALGRRRRTVAAIAFGLAVAVKFLPIVLVPLYWRRIRIRDALMAVLVVGMLYVPFLEHGHFPIGSLGVYVQRFRFNDPLFSSLEHFFDANVAVALAVGVGLVTAVWLRSKNRSCSPAEWAWPMAMTLSCAPVVYPWYLLWLLPFLRSLSAPPLLVWSVSILSTYFVWHLHALGLRWQVPLWVTILEYGPVLLTAGFILLRQGRARPAAPATEIDKITKIST
jgi:hypothetical protein